MGLGMAVILVTCFAASAWMNDQEARVAAVNAEASKLAAAGPLLAENVKRAVAENDLAGVRRLVADTAAGLKTGRLSVRIGGGILADSIPSRVNITKLPEHWSAPTAADDQGGAAPQAQFTFAVPNRGAGLVELFSQPPLARSVYSRSGASALICAVGLCLLVLVYRRSRSGLAAMETVASALDSMARGETSAAALEVDQRLGAIAIAWNKLMTEIEDLRRRCKAAAAPASGNRRGGSGGLEAACDAMSQGLILVDDKLTVRFCNGAASTFLKRDRAAIAGSPAADLVEDPKFKDAIAATADGKLRRPVTVELEEPGDSGGVLRFCVRPVRRGDVDSAMILIEDITQQRTAEKARNQFINQVTHELRTPLTNIRLYTETAIEDGDSDPGIRANCLNVINGESRRLERIVSEMLSVAEIEAGATTVKRDDVYFDQLVKELENDYRAQADEKKISLQFNVSPKLPKLQADKDKLAIAVHNLLGNALKYTPEGGKVTVTVDVRDGQLAIDVADTGIGIDKKETDKIFDRFYRSQDPRIGKIVGTGLGLTLAREVMRLHGGDITVESVINRGSTFTATMPVNLAA